MEPWSRLAPKAPSPMLGAAAWPRGQEPSLRWQVALESPGTGASLLSLCLPPWVWLSREGFMDVKAEPQGRAEAKWGPACASSLLPLQTRSPPNPQPPAPVSSPVLRVTVRAK